MGMFFDTKGIFWTLAALAAVVAVCLLDVRCASARDARAPTAPSGALAHVKEELTAGRQAWRQLREDQLNEQLRMLRVLAKRCVEKGDHVRARATIALIQEIEAAKRRRAR